MKAQDTTTAAAAATRERTRAERRARLSVHHSPMPDAAKARAVEAMCRHLSGVYGGARFAVVVPGDDKTVDGAAPPLGRQDVDAGHRAA